MDFLLLLRFFDFVELGIHLQQFFFGEADVQHTDHACDTQDGKAESHIHEAGIHLREGESLLFGVDRQKR